MPNYDLVFCSGLTAREALSCRRAVICCDDRGLGGMISVHRLKDWNNNLGLKVLTQALTVENLIREIGRYDAIDAMKAAEGFAAECSMSDCAQRYEAIYGLAMAEGDTSPEAAPAAAVVEFIEAFCRKPGTPRLDAPARGVRKAGASKQSLVERLRTIFPG